MINSSMEASIFKNLKNCELPEVFRRNAIYKDSSNPNKVNLGMGVYADDNGLPWTLPAISEAEYLLSQDKTIYKDYIPMTGTEEFKDAAVRLLLGADHKVILEKRVEVFQTAGGAGAFRLASTFMNDQLGMDTVYVANPTWANAQIFLRAGGFSQIKEYRYWNAETKSLDFEGMIEDLQAACSGALVLLQPVGHNPTGVDPSQEQWKEIAKVCKEKQLVVLLDNAYQGLVTGDLEEDAWVFRYFADQDMDLFVAQTFSKNFGLYCERIGALTVITKDGQKCPEIRSQVEQCIMKIWSFPPAHGSRVFTRVLNDNVLCKKWKEQVMTMTVRIKKMRHALVDNLKMLGTPGNWDHIITQTGMYSYTGLTAKQVDHMISKHVFMVSTGRISIPGLTSKNVQYVARCMDEAVRAYQ